jgi:hypothetical protein
MSLTFLRPGYNGNNSLKSLPPRVLMLFLSFVITLVRNKFFTTEAQRAQREFSSDPIGRRRLDQKLHPSGIETHT